MSKQSPELQQLIKAMADFSDAISLCNLVPSAMRSRMRDAMKAFRTKYDESRYVLLIFMNASMGEISHEYEELLQSSGQRTRRYYSH